MVDVADIKKAYKDQVNELLPAGLRMTFSTDRSFGPAHEDDVHALFKAINLKRCRNLLDMGSGDGRVVLIASLFTTATGVELDERLYKKSLEMARALRLKARFRLGDYMDEDLSKYDVVFIYPDKPFKDGLEKRLREGFRGKLIVYSSLYLPLHFKLLKTLDTPDDKIYVYDVR